MRLMLKLRIFLFLCVSDGQFFLKISQMLVVLCYCYNFHIFLSFASESRVARNTILIQRDVLWTGKFNDGPGRCSDERGRPLRDYYQFHVKQNNCIYLQNIVILTVYIVFNIVYCAKSMVY